MEKFPGKRTVFSVEDERALCNLIVGYISSLPALQLVGFANDRKKTLEAFELGAVDYLQRPFTLERFLKAIGRVNRGGSRETAHYS